MLFCVMRVFEKNGVRSFFPKYLFNADSFTDAYNQFKKQRLCRSGLYILVLLDVRKNDYDVCPVYEFPSYFVKPLFTRFFRWSDDGKSCQETSYFGNYYDVKEGDPEVLFKLILENKPLSSSLNFGNDISTNFDAEDLI